MINFPILERLDISGYGLFPGESGGPPGLHVEFQRGLTLVLGANGLGKSTLVAIAFRLLTGPVDIPGLALRTDLGTVRLEVRALPTDDCRVFAQRVADGAREARARLAVRFGSQTLVVERRLSDLSLTHLSVDGSIHQNPTEDTFQNAILAVVGLGSFGDWVLLLRHLVFYFEDRRALVWDASAQRQLLRLLFLPPDQATRWMEAEREILELDSRMRNLNYATGREERALAKNETKTQSGAAIRRELETLEELQKTDEAALETLESGIVEIEAARQQARLKRLRAEQEREGRFRELEKARLTAISARFPTRSETARYILAQLLTEETCLVCDHPAHAAAAAYAKRIQQKACVVCGTDLSASDNVVPPSETADRLVEQEKQALNAVDVELQEARQSLEEAQQRYDRQVADIQRLNCDVDTRSERIDFLVKRLPPSEASMHKQRKELATMRARVEVLRRELDDKRKAFDKLLVKVNRDLATQAEGVKTAFHDYAEGFLVETCRLFWNLRKLQLGQTGHQIDSPSFTLEMTGTDFTVPQIRTGPEQVSESQREFIDLAFRMALIAVAGSGGTGSLVIDAPESSLDAVFVGRAATVLSRFAQPKRGNRLVVTSNLVASGLVPELLARVPERTRAKRIVDLLTIAVPTAAVRSLHDDYERVRVTLLQSTGTKI